MKYWFLLFALSVASYTYSKESIEEMEQRLNETSGQTRVELLIDLSFEWKYVSFEKAFVYAYKALSLAKKLDHIPLQASAHNRIGNTHRISSRQDSALYHVLQALKIAESIGEQKAIATYLNSMALIYMELADYDEALSYLERSLTIRKEINPELSKDIATSLHNLGSVHYHLKRYDEALGFYLEALMIKQQLKNFRSLALTMDKIGLTYMAIQNYYLAEQYFQQVLNIRREIKFTIGQAVSLKNLGELSTLRGEYNLALSYFQQALDLLGKHNVKTTNLGLLYQMGKTYQLMGNYEQAIKSLEESLRLAKLGGHKDKLSRVYEQLAKTYAAQEEYQQAWQYIEKYVALHDTLFDNSLAKKIAKAQVAYENAQKDERISQMNKHARLRDYLLATLSLCVLLLLALMITTYRRYRSRKSLSNLLAKQNELLYQSNEELERFAYVASHDLKEPLRMVAGFVQLLDRRYGPQLDDRAREYIGYAVEGVKRVYQLLDDLLAYARIVHKEEKSEAVEVASVLKQVLTNLETQIQSNKAEVNIQKHLPTIHQNRVFLIQIFQNLISNGIKFRRDETPKIEVKYSSTHQWHQFSVIDNGIGISKAHQNKVFVLFQRLHTYDQIEGTGIGLAICKKIIEKIGGKIWMDSVEGQGTHVHFTLPVTHQISKNS